MGNDMNATSSFRDILDILACPKCLGPLILVERKGATGLACPQCRVVYPVTDGIPVLLVEEAVERSTWDAANPE
jgi:uncharacterized protein YbaR (Trm112 family)